MAPRRLLLPWTTWAVFMAWLVSACHASPSSSSPPLPPLAVDVELTPDGVAVVAEQAHTRAVDPDGPPGWRMSDRFRAFRFARTLPRDSTGDTDDDSTAAFMARVAAVARDQRCFGWIQVTEPRHVAGEARCPARTVAAMEAQLRLDTDTDNGDLVLRYYAISKIRYHFPTFRVLSEPLYQGKTCFRTPPHACAST